VIRQPDGTESLLLRQAHLSVVKGPDQGLTMELTNRRVLLGTGRDCDLQLTDGGVSRHHLELRATEQGYLLRDLDSTNGTLLGGVRLVRAILTDATLFTIGSTTLRLDPCDVMVEIPLSRRGVFGRLLGQSTAMREVFALLESVAATDTTVLLEGESGTGKELAAEAIHEASPRRHMPFVILDCGAMPEHLVESELFGHERGAFTGADQAREGAAEQANGGTIFLDEVAEIPLPLQPRLLRFLENRQVKRLGATRHRRVNVRVIAATNRLLANETREGRFRADLFHRLSVVRIEMPALRHRPDDILLLAYHFAKQFAADPGELLPGAIEKLLLAYHWPGNARELRNAIERIAIAPDDGAELLRSGKERSPALQVDSLLELPFHEARQQCQESFERRYLEIHLQRVGGVVARVAEEVELPRQTVYRLLKRHGLREPEQ